MNGSTGRTLSYLTSTTAGLSTLFGISMISAPILNAQLPDVRALEEKLTAQSKLLVAQQAQLAALQASLEQQAATLAEQKKLLDNLMAASRGGNPEIPPVNPAPPFAGATERSCSRALAGAAVRTADCPLV